MNWTEFLTVFLIAFASNLFGSIAGSAISLIQTPLLIALGYPPKEVLGVSRIANWGNAVGSFYQFRKKGLVDLKLFWPYFVAAIGGLVIGLYILVIIDPEALKKMIGWVVLAVIPFLFIGNSGLEQRTVSNIKRKVSYITEFLARIILTVLSSGTVVLITLNHLNMAGMTLLQSSALKRTSGLVGPLIIAGVLFQRGLMPVDLIPPMLLGGFAGGWLGSKIAIKKGNKFVRKMLMIAAAGIAIKIIFF